MQSTGNNPNGNNPNGDALNADDMDDRAYKPWTRGLRYRRDDLDPTLWLYEATEPSARADDQGNPLVSLIDAGDFGFFQLSVQLDPPAAVLEELRAFLATTHRVEAVRLRSAVSHVDTARVLICRDADTDHELASTTSSGFAPYTAALQCQVSGDDLTAVRSALAGQRSRLRVLFDYETPFDTASAVIDVADLVTRTTSRSPSAAASDQPPTDCFQEE